MTKLLPAIFFIFIYVFPTACFSQSSKRYDITDADEHFKHNNFTMALAIYKELSKTEKANLDIQYKIALCYLHTYFNKAAAIPYLESVTKHEKFDTKAWLSLGEAYRVANRLDDAIKAFTRYKEKEPKKKTEADRQIEICNNAKELMKHPVNVSFTNLGPDINSEFADYYPWINQDETFLAFTTRRKGISASRLEMDGYYASDVYTSQLESGKWAKALNAGYKVNTSLDEQVVGLKADASMMLIYIDHIDKFGDIYSTVKKNGLFQKIQPLPEIINKRMELAASISPDGNTLFFVRQESSDESTDIYMVRVLPSGEWAEPQKLGPEINTGYNENFPYLSLDGQTLYFASEGHNTMGGYDLFKSTWSPETNTWSKAVNLGYPVNTTDDDRSISLTPDNRVGYISALRPGGHGDLDIYRIRFNDVDQKMTLYTGNVMLGDTMQQQPEYTVSITARNNGSKEEFSFTPNPKSGRFVMALPAGNYTITVSSEGYTDYEEQVQVSDFGSMTTEVTKRYFLRKK